MAVTVDYLVVYSEEMDLMELLTKMLKNALEDVDDEPPEEEELRDYIYIRYTKRREDFLYICGFSVEFDRAEERMSELIDKFSEAVVDCEDKGIKHLLKLYDPQLRCTLRTYADDIFEIEMKLREALSLIFVHTYGEDFYRLLKHTNVKPSKDCTIDQMEDCYGNQFFFLGFTQYSYINERKDPSLERVVQHIGQAQNFEELKQLITTKEPITEPQYTQFLKDVKKLINQIEDIRNCVAHNRPIPDELKGSYETAKQSLLEEINKFRKKLANCEVSDETETRN